MPPRQKIPAPIDRPLSRAYLREFSGWSTAYAPGISDPTSLRLMENVMINRDGSARVRPGLRYLSFQEGTDVELGGLQATMVGTHEPFYLNDGSKAYLFAVREDDGTVGFRVLSTTPLGQVVQGLDAEGIGFELPADPTELNFSANTTYVKYLQIDNKIFALSDAGETMRLFTVGEAKTAKVLRSIERPEWSAADKLTVVHPDAGWINNGTPSEVLTNYVTNPSMENNTSGWVAGTGTSIASVGLPHVSPYQGNKALQLVSLPTRTNLCPQPLHNVQSTGTTGWTAGIRAASVAAVSNGLRCTSKTGIKGERAVLEGPKVPVVAGKAYRAACTLVAINGSATNFGIRIRFFNTAGGQIGDNYFYALGTTGGRKVTWNINAPSGAVRMQVMPYVVAGNNNAVSFTIKDFLVALANEPTDFFYGGSGTNYFWTGAANGSSSVYHPPRTVSVGTVVGPITPGDWVGSLYTVGTKSRDVTLNIRYSPNLSSSGTLVEGEPVENNSSSHVRVETTGEAPEGTVYAFLEVSVAGVERGERHYIDAVMFEEGDTASTYFDGGFTDTDTIAYAWLGAAHASASTKSTLTTGIAVPDAETPTGNTLISSTAKDNLYNFGFFYTFSNEIGESAASQVTVVRTQRPWQAWRWETANTDGEPSGTAANDPGLCADQLVAFMPEEVFTSAIDQGATSWTLYVFTWSDQDPVPVLAVQAARRELSADSLYGSTAWLRVTPMMADAGDTTAAIPSADKRYNYSNPSRGGQGIVAADRMVLVKDPSDAAVIRWTSNLQGSYTDFSATRGGGYKTLTSGNLHVPAAVKLWQNPQSNDTLVVLCMGTDGHSTAYYMAPAQVTSQTEAVNIMAFEETTATPGTVAPYGCEVLNNALYHPLDEQLMKSTANNYSINHTSMTENIQNMWLGLTSKQWIISSQLDDRLYYLVNNPAGAPLENGCKGNEVWVLDTASKEGTWSRWLTQGISLRKIEQGGRVVMSLVRPEGIYYFDDSYDRDDYIVAGPSEAPDDLVVRQRFIPWKLETNTQGANRAHDAWAHLQQCNVVLGNFTGQLRYGVRSWDINGHPVDISKVVHGFEASDDAEEGLAFDQDDYLLIKRDLREWFFYAESVTDDDTGEVLHSSGQISLVQYRYTPSSVNTGYEFGSVETFEYTRAAVNPADPGFTTNGTPQPMIDTRRP